jgi:hypothetical protein
MLIAGGADRLFHPPTQPRTDAAFTKRPQRPDILALVPFFQGGPLSLKRANLLTRPTLGAPKRAVSQRSTLLDDPSELARCFFRGARAD